MFIHYLMYIISWMNINFRDSQGMLIGESFEINFAINSAPTCIIFIIGQVDRYFLIHDLLALTLSDLI